MAVTALTFAYASQFVNLPDGVLDATITEVYAEWSGTQELWATLDATVRDAKRDQVIQYLVAWKLADFYPECVNGIASNGGMPLASKDIGGTVLKMLPIKHQEGMYMLFTNTFGLHAYQMIVSAPERFGLHNSPGPFVGTQGVGLYGF